MPEHARWALPIEGINNNHDNNEVENNLLIVDYSENKRMQL
jgi:hypothetical protein